MIEVRPLGGGGVAEIRTRRLADARGFFSENWSRAAFAAAGVHYDFVQDNHSCSVAAGVLRGLHYQLPPAAQAKLVRVTRGSAYDVAVDLRRGSAGFGLWVGLILSAEEWNQVLIPAGFAHGFLTLEPGTEVQYKVTAPYDAGLDRAIRFDDPAIGVDWPLTASALILSPRDRCAPLLADAEIPPSWE